MKAADPRATIKELFANGGEYATATRTAVLVKTCGMKSVADAKSSLEAGANLIGVIFAEKSPRKVSLEEAAEIVAAVRAYGERTSSVELQGLLGALRKEKLMPKLWFTRTMEVLKKVTTRQPLVVGVFQDQSVEQVWETHLSRSLVYLVTVTVKVNEIVLKTGIDVAQLHGDEDVSFIGKVLVPCIKVIHVPVAEGGAEVAPLKETIRAFSNHALALLFDSMLPGAAKSGGAGKTFDWSLVGERF